jgi:endonuclease/exonuclease/phosphatase family metal-dependent hydrolase
VSLLTYNVQDLPYWIAGDRSGDLAAIGARLAELRANGAAPQLVVLQEAFSEEPVAMLRSAGYRHIITGADANVPRPPSPERLDQTFLDARSILRGEAQAPQLSSGLVIASDFPIVAAVSTPFPADACAGIDCLANKGVLLARIALPGTDVPLELVTTHLNAGRKSRTPPAHHLYAYRQQLKAFDRFLAQYGNPEAIRLIAGDFNVSHSGDRLVALRGHAARWNVIPVTAMGKDKDAHECRSGAFSCRDGLPIASNVPLVHTLDWQFTGAAGGVAIQPVARHVLFGREADGSMFSDHIGYAVRYRLGTQNTRRNFLRRVSFPPQENGI